MIVTSHKGSDQDNYSKTQLYEKNLPFHVLYNFAFLCFSITRQAAYAL